MKLKIVKIDWIDSKAAPNEWERIVEITSLKPVACTSVGFLIEDKPAYKTLAHSLSGTQVCGRITIPTACIKKCKRLK